MTEIAISLELILGIIGSVTGLMGATSLIIHILRYLKEKPKIEAELVDPKHHYQRRGENEKNYHLSFILETYEVKIDIHDVEVFWRLGERLKEKFPEANNIDDIVYMLRSAIDFLYTETLIEQLSNLTEQNRGYKGFSPCESPIQFSKTPF